MGGLRHSSPVSVSSRSSKASNAGVAFAGVTGVSRPLSNDEHWSLYYFEAHAAQCDSCYKPLEVSRSGKKLCDEGHQLAIDVAAMIFRRSDGEVYSRVRDGEQEVRVEIPHGYDQTLSLLKAIQRALKNGQRFVKPESHDRTYLVGSRRPTEKVKHDRAMPVKPTSSSAKPYDTITVEPTLSARRPRHQQHDSRRDSKRGSLYGIDMGELERAEQRDQKLRYNLEVRAPTARR